MQYLLTHISTMTIKDTISAIIKEKRLDLKRDILPAIEMTEPGYYSMFRNDSIKVSTLKKIADSLKVPVTSFFIEDSQTKKNNSKAKVVIELHADDVLNIDIKNRRLEIVKK